MCYYYVKAREQNLASINDLIVKQLKIALKKFLHTHWFYTIEEFLSLLWIKNGILRSYYSSILIFSSII